MRAATVARPVGPADSCVVVVFCDRVEIPWLRWLRRGFRHCFVVLDAGVGWLAVEALSTGTCLTLFPPQPVGNLLAGYRRAGHRALAVACRPRLRARLPWSPFTCVELAKRLVGCRTPSVVTPYQFYRYLSKNRKKCFTFDF